MIVFETVMIGLLVATRITAGIFTAPVLGNVQVPIRFRILLAILLTTMTTPVLSTKINLGSDWVSMFFGELVIGISLGLGVSILFAAAQMVGASMSQMASIPVTEIIPNLASPIGNLFCLLSVAVFILMNGPELMVASLLGTFAELPPGISLNLYELDQLAIDLLRQSFLLTLRGVAPAVAAILVSTLVVGMIGKNYPQLNLLEFGIGSNLAILMVAILMTISGCVWLFVDDVQNIHHLIKDRLQQSVQTKSVEEVSAPGLETQLLEEAGHVRQ